MNNPLARLPKNTKKNIRVFHRALIAFWRRYPKSLTILNRSQLKETYKAEFEYIWHKSVTPIPTRGDERTRYNRINNLEQAIRSLNNLLIKPGQVISLVTAIGSTTKANGYLDGPVFVNGSVRSDVGGGLCLIATNLYQLFLYSGFEIIERHNHSIDAYGSDRFYTLGEDAAISSAYKDLVVKNSFNVPLHLQIMISGTVVQSSLCSIAKNQSKIHVESFVLDKHYPHEKQKQTGWTVYTTRLIQKDSASRWTNDYSAWSRYSPF